jgi:hypothetical protein
MLICSYVLVIIFFLAPCYVPYEFNTAFFFSGTTPRVAQSQQYSSTPSKGATRASTCLFWSPTGAAVSGELNGNIVRYLSPEGPNVHEHFFLVFYSSLSFSWPRRVVGHPASITSYSIIRAVLRPPSKFHTCGKFLNQKPCCHHLQSLSGLWYDTTDRSCLSSTPLSRLCHISVVASRFGFVTISDGFLLDLSPVLALCFRELLERPNHFHFTGFTPRQGSQSKRSYDQR